MDHSANPLNKFPDQSIVPELALLRPFADESNKIEGMGPATQEEVAALVHFVERDVLTLNDLEEYVHVIQPNAKLRIFPTMNVQVGSHVAPQGGPGISALLKNILESVNHNTFHPYLIHHHYETLHPFMDGNGRSGRAVWAWQMVHHGYWPGLRLGFLHCFYYQTLDWGRPGYDNFRDSLSDAETS